MAADVKSLIAKLRKSYPELDSDPTFDKLADAAMGPGEDDGMAKDEDDLAMGDDKSMDDEGGGENSDVAPPVEINGSFNKPKRKPSPFMA